jgi:UTP:GlnB (protein PII) uridylyltransferase
VVSREDIQKMVDLIVERFQPEKVILFGSYARGEAGPDSDVDLVVVTRDETTDVREQAVAIGSAIRQVPVAKDILVRTRRQFEQETAAYWTVFHEAAAEGVVLFERAG